MTYQALTRLKRELEEAGLSDAFGRQAYDHGRQSIVASSSADGFGMEAHGMATRELLRTSHGDSNDAFITLRQFHQWLPWQVDTELYYSDGVVAN